MILATIFRRSLQLFPGTRMEHVGSLGTLGFLQAVESRAIISLNWRGRGLFGNADLLRHRRDRFVFLKVRLEHMPDNLEIGKSIG